MYETSYSPHVPDYGRNLEFGISLVPEAANLDTILAASREADHGLDFIGVQDHPYQRRFLDTLTLLTAIAAETDRIRVFPDVACLPLRPPAILANESASIDIISGGRFELGLGAGGFWDAIAGMGGPRRSPAEALQALEEAVEVIRLLWSGQRGIRYDGDHYTINGIHSGPLPAHDIEIWFGVYGPRACRLLGRVADGWIPSLGRMQLDDLDARHEIIDEAAAEAGRDPSQIRRLVNVAGTITDGETEGSFTGTESQWVEQLTALSLNHGFDSYIFWPETDPVDQTRRFVAVAEETLSAVAKERS